MAEIDFGGQVLIEYVIPKGAGRGAYLEFISVMNSKNTRTPESEFLLKRNLKVRIKDIEEMYDNKVFVKAEVL